MNIHKKLTLLLALPLLFAIPAFASAAPGVIENTDTGETFSAIQAAIDDTDTDNGDTLEVGNGTYTEAVNIDKQVTLTAENTLDATIDGHVDINASSSTLNGFVITDSSDTEVAGVTVQSNPTLTNVTISNNDINGYMPPATGANNPTGIWIQAGTAINIDSNEISNASSSGKTAQGILIGGTSNSGDLTDITVSGNEIHHISGSPGGFGITVNRRAENLDITENNFHDINSTLAFPSWATDGISYTVAVALDATTPNVIVDRNDFSDLTSADLKPVAINFNLREGNDAATSSPVTIEQNNFFFNQNEGVIGANYDTGNMTPSEDLDVEENYWNDHEGPSGPEGEADSSGALAGKFIDYSPWLCNEAVSSQTTTDGENCFDLDDDINEKVAVCHAPPGNPANAHTINISENAVFAHLGHGDTLSACDEDDDRDENSDFDRDEEDEDESDSNEDDNESDTDKDDEDDDENDEDEIDEEKDDHPGNGKALGKKRGNAGGNGKGHGR